MSSQFLSLVLLGLVLAQCNATPHHRYHYDSSEEEEGIRVRIANRRSQDNGNVIDQSGDSVQGNIEHRPTIPPRPHVVIDNANRPTQSHVVTDNANRPPKPHVVIDNGNRPTQSHVDIDYVNRPFKPHYDLENVNRGVSTILTGVGSGRLSEILRGSFMFTRNNHTRSVANAVLDSIFGRRDPDVAAKVQSREGWAPLAGL